jgi:CBS domain-containing protein/sporulation protein YlmC with PRC-barrel domain
MLYLSELIGKSVVSSHAKKIGKLTDLVFVTSDVPSITKLQVRTSRTTTKLFPISAVKRINGTIVLQKTEEVTLAENEVYVGLNLLDQQIIDIQGKNVVRVNDVTIQDKPTLVISGIDIGLTGILRWFNLEKVSKKIAANFGKTLGDKLLPWSEIQPLELARGKVVLNQEEAKLKSIAPEDLADYLEKTTIQNAMKILSLVNDETASEVIQNLNINYQTQIFKQMNPEDAAQIVTFADPDEATDLLITVSEEKRQHILSLLSETKKKELTFLLSHAQTSIGELMTTEYLTFYPEDTVKTVIERIRKESGGIATLPYGYVQNKKEELVGVFSLHELLLQPTETQLIKFMSQSVTVIHVSTPKIVAIKRMLKYKLRAMPVMDTHRKLIGIVTFDDVVEPILEKL